MLYRSSQISKEERNDESQKRSMSLQKRHLRHDRGRRPQRCGHPVGGHGRDRRGQGLREMQGFSRISDPGHSGRDGERDKSCSAINQNLGRTNMECVNIFGLIFIVVIMIPNIIFALKCKDGFENKWNNRSIEMVEQIGRFGCLGFMIVNIPGTWFGWWSDEAFALYLVVDTVLAILYCVIWMICFKKNSMFRAMALSIIPSILFLFSGIMSRSVLLIISAVLFAPSHIMISYKNAK